MMPGIAQRHVFDHPTGNFLTIFFLRELKTFGTKTSDVWGCCCWLFGGCLVGFFFLFEYLAFGFWFWVFFLGEWNFATMPFLGCRVLWKWKSRCYDKITTILEWNLIYLTSSSSLSFQFWAYPAKLRSLQNCRFHKVWIHSNVCQPLWWLFL